MSWGISKKYGIPKEYCSCPYCTLEYGSAKTGDMIHEDSGLCEKCFFKKYPNARLCENFLMPQEFIEAFMPHTEHG